ncbi:unnamed protein product, partial [Didymodactylos carnosus]
MTMAFSNDYILDSERIVDVKQHEDYLFCPICRNPLWKPVSCKTCEKSFCKRCIDEWLRSQNAVQKRCPSSNCLYIEKRCSPLLNSLLSRVLARCQYSNFGCQQIVLYDSLVKHEDECEYRAGKCRGCKKELLEKDVKLHEQNCEQILIHCELCHCNIKQSTLKLHFIECSKKQLKLVKNDLTRELKKNETELRQTITSMDNDNRTTLKKFESDMKVLENTISWTHSTLLARLDTVGNQLELLHESNTFSLQEIDNINSSIKALEEQIKWNKATFATLEYKYNQQEQAKNDIQSKLLEMQERIDMLQNQQKQSKAIHESLR